MAKRGKDSTPRSSEGFISEALTGGSGPSSGVDKKGIGDGQTLVTSFPPDNVKLAMPMESSLRDGGGFAGGVDNLGHSIAGASAKNTTVNAAGPTKEVRHKDH